MIQKMIVRLGFGIIQGYQKFISPLIPPRCRYYPTCSNYAKDALRWHGVAGIKLIIKRIVSCHPWGGCGVDFVPLPLARFYYLYVPQASKQIPKQGFGAYRNTKDYGAYRNMLLNQPKSRKDNSAFYRNLL